MKKFFMIVAAALLMTVSANAKMYVGGSLGFGNSFGPFRGQFIPEVGFSIGDRDDLAAGAYMKFGFASQTFDWNVNPYFRWTFVHVNDFGIFMEPSIGIGTTSVAKSTAFYFNILVTPGVAYYINDNWALVGRMGNIGYERQGGVGEFAFSLNLNPTIGVVYHISR